jgi:hypothetical protein
MGFQKFGHLSLKTAGEPDARNDSDKRGNLPEETSKNTSDDEKGH